MSVQSTKGNPFTKEEMAAARALLSLRSSAPSKQRSSAPAQEPRPQRACVQQRQQKSARPRRSTADYTPGIYTGQE
jgi:hypothetical protein